MDGVHPSSFGPGGRNAKSGERNRRRLALIVPFTTATGISVYQTFGVTNRVMKDSMQAPVSPGVNCCCSFRLKQEIFASSCDCLSLGNSPTGGDLKP